MQVAKEAKFRRSPFLKKGPTSELPGGHLPHQLNEVMILPVIGLDRPTHLSKYLNH